MTRDEAKAAVIAAAMDWAFSDGSTEEGETTSERLDKACTALHEMPAPECDRCNDRGRIWSGPDGDTEHCPQCAAWGVWWANVDGWWEGPTTLRRAQSIADICNRNGGGAEVRRYAPEEK